MFKSLSIYRVDTKKATVYSQLLGGPDHEDALRAVTSLNEPRWPGKHDPGTRGFIFPPLSVTSQAIDPTGLTGLRNFLPITQVVYTKAMDGAAVKCEVDREVKRIKQDQGRNVGRRELQDIKDEIIFGLLQNAPVKAKHTRAFLTSDGYILIDATGKQAEDFLSHLRDALGSLPVRQFAQKELRAINTFVKRAIEDRYLAGMNEDSTFEVTGSFCFALGNEKITIQNGEEETVSDQLFDRIRKPIASAKWCEFKTEHDTFRITDTFQLKGIKLELEYEPENEDEEPISAAWHRFYLEHFLKLANDLRLAVGKFALTEDEDRADD